MAIKVNGTTVINDSRALQNIASVDSATATAIGNAGVGGATSLIQGYTSLSSASALTFNLNHGYDVYYLDLYDMKHSDSGTREVVARLGNSSGTLITSAESHWTQYAAGTQQQFPNNSYFFLCDSWQPQSYSGQVNLRLKIYYMEESNRRTMIEFYGWSIYDYGGAAGFYPISSGTHFGQACANTAQVNRNISFFAFGSTTISNAKYQLWGVNL